MSRRLTTGSPVPVARQRVALGPLALAEVGGAHARVLHDDRRGAVGDRCPEVECHDPIGDREEVVEDVVDDHDRCAGVLEVADLFREDLAFRFVQAAERLVEEDEVRSLRHGAREVGALLQPERQLARVAVLHVGQTDARQECRCGSPLARAGSPLGAEEVLLDRQLIEELGVLERARDAHTPAARGARLEQVVALVADRAGDLAARGQARRAC